MGKPRRNKAMYCVIMGDIINSRSLSDEVREKVTQAAKMAFDQINSRYRGSFLANFGLVRGDSFEGILLAQHHAPQIMQDIIKTFYRVEKTLVRISVVMGQLTITSTDRNEVDGPAFVDVQAALAKIKERGSKHWMQVSFDVGTLGRELISSQLGLITALTERWTDKQREICWIAEEIEGHEDYPKETTKKLELYRLVAKKLNSTPAVIKKQMTAAYYEAYRQGWDGIESYLMEIDEHVDKDKSIIEESYIPYLNMGRRKLDQHNFNEALPLLEKALSLAIDTLDENDLQLAIIYTCLATAYTRTKNYGKAEAMIQSALLQQMTQPKTERYIETLVSQANLYYRESEYTKSKAILEEAIAIASDLLNSAHPLWSDLYNDLANVLDGMGYNNAAHEYYLKAREHVPRTPIDYAVILSNTAISYLHLSKLVEARKHAEAALRIYEESVLSNHRYISNTQQLLKDIVEAEKGGKQ